MKIHAVNKRAVFDYEILETYEAGMVLRGYEVKSVKNGHLSMKGAFVRFEKQGKKIPVFHIVNMHISRYKQAGEMPDYDPERPRALLLHKREMERLMGKKSEQGLTLIPTKVYTKKGYIKIEIALAKGKKQHDKRESIKNKDVDRDIARAMKRR